MQFQNNVFIVTGGASGLGEETARMLHGLGAKVVIADMQADKGNAVAASLGANAVFQKTDISNEDEAKACVNLAVEKFGAVNALINCAGIGGAEKVLGKEGPHRLSSFERTIRVNLIGTFNMIRLAADAMSRNEPNAGGERGVIVNTASVAAYDGQMGQAAYAASKGGIVSMTLPIARDLSRNGIRICTIAPGLFRTPLMDELPPDVQESLGKAVPFPSRLGRPDEYAALVKHIVENEMLNGETIRLDGAIRLAPR